MLFTVITVVGVVYVVFRYVGAGALVGLGPYHVRVQLPEAGNLTPSAAVSYRGLEIGEVESVRVVPGGVDVALAIEHGTPAVPASAVAVVADRSAIGEPYLDLRPASPGPPFLADGSTIPRERTRTPLPVAALLTSLEALAASVPTPELTTTVDELYTAFARTGPDLARLLDSGTALVADARGNLPRTTELLRDSRVVLDTQSRLGPQITALGRDLRVFSDQLRRDDPHLGRLVTATPAAATRLEGLIREAGPDLSRTLANLLTVTRILEPRLAGIEQVLVTAPFGAAIGDTVLPGDGRLHFGLVLNIDDPPPCRAGYLQPGNGWRPATALDTANLPATVGCNQDPPTNVRGARNSPTPAGPPPAIVAGMTTR